MDRKKGETHDCAGRIAEIGLPLIQENGAKIANRQTAGFHVVFSLGIWMIWLSISAFIEIADRITLSEISNAIGTACEGYRLKYCRALVDQIINTKNF